MTIPNLLDGSDHRTIVLPHRCSHENLPYEVLEILLPSREKVHKFPTMILFYEPEADIGTTYGEELKSLAGLFGGDSARED